MVGVCFKQERRPVYQDQWSYLFSNFGIESIFQIPVENGADLYQATKKIANAGSLPKDKSLVVVQPQDGKYVQGTESLSDFEHPDDAIYMFGGSHDVMTLEDLGGRVPEHTVFIPLVKHECYAFSAAYMVLWDRKVKNG